MHVEPHRNPDQLAALIRTEPRAKVVRRLTAVAPELNPVERLWPYLRDHHWSNRVYEDIAALERATEGAWRPVCLNLDQIKTVCRCTYAETGSYTAAVRFPPVFKTVRAVCERAQSLTE